MCDKLRYPPSAKKRCHRIDGIYFAASCPRNDTLSLAPLLSTFTASPPCFALHFPRRTRAVHSVKQRNTSQITGDGSPMSMRPVLQYHGFCFRGRRELSVLQLYVVDVHRFSRCFALRFPRRTRAAHQQSRGIRHNHRRRVAMSMRPVLQ